MNWATSLAMLMMGFALLSAVQTRAQQPQPSAAVAQVDITPPMGMPMAGYYHPRGADGVLDPLYCKALVIEVGGMRAALVSLDLISVTRAITDQARTDIEAATGIPADHVLISATHAHTGPELARDSLRVDDMGGSNQETVTYTQELPRKIQDCVQKACDALQPVQIEMAKGLCHDLAFNRRYFMRDGSVGWNPGKLNPDIMLPAGPTDPEVGILYVQQPAATSPVQGGATYVNFAMHPDTTGGTKFSADWPACSDACLPATMDHSISRWWETVPAATSTTTTSPGSGPMAVRSNRIALRPSWEHRCCRPTSIYSRCRSLRWPSAARASNSRFPP